MKQGQSQKSYKTCWAQPRCVHGLLWLEARARPKNASARGPKWHGPDLNHVSPWIEGRTPAHARESTLTAATGARGAVGLGLVTALAAGLLGVLATLADVGDRATIGVGVARITRVGFRIGGRRWSGVLLLDEHGMVGDGGSALGVEELLHEEVSASADEGVWRLA
jgi:hypothetical protein